MAWVDLVRADSARLWPTSVLRQASTPTPATDDCYTIQSAPNLAMLRISSSFGKHVPLENCWHHPPRSVLFGIFGLVAIEQQHWDANAKPRRGLLLRAASNRCAPPPEIYDHPGKPTSAPRLQGTACPKGKLLLPPAARLLSTAQCLPAPRHPRNQTATATHKFRKVSRRARPARRETAYHSEAGHMQCPSA